VAKIVFGSAQDRMRFFGEKIYDPPSEFGKLLTAPQPGTPEYTYVTVMTIPVCSTSSH
jgi:hypothetical protein